MSKDTTIRIDWKMCDGHAVCAELLPELISLDEWGYPVVAPGPIPHQLLGHSKRAAASCPALALHLTKAPAR